MCYNLTKYSVTISVSTVIANTHTLRVLSKKKKWHWRIPNFANTWNQMPDNRKNRECHRQTCHCVPSLRLSPWGNLLDIRWMWRKLPALLFFFLFWFLRPTHAAATHNRYFKAFVKIIPPWRRCCCFPFLNNPHSWLRPHMQVFFCPGLKYRFVI